MTTLKLEHKQHKNVLGGGDNLSFMKAFNNHQWMKEPSNVRNFSSFKGERSKEKDREEGGRN